MKQGFTLELGIMVEFLNTGENPIHCEYFITVTVPSLDKSCIEYLGMSFVCHVSSTAFTVELGT